MKIAFVYGKWSTADRYFNFSQLYDDPRGLTGSEISCFEYAKAMRMRGHDIVLFAQTKNIAVPYNWNGVIVKPVDELKLTAGSFDVIYVWNEPDVLFNLTKKPLKMVNQQLNDFEYCSFGDFAHVDVFTSPNEIHRDFLKEQIKPQNLNWEILPNGCDPNAFPQLERVPGKVIWASSPDRGLHWLLQEWMTIKKAVPEANLKIFYNFDDWFAKMFHVNPGTFTDSVEELACRARYIKEACKRLADHGVTHLKSVSRNQMAMEMAQAQVLPYSCDPIRFTEGFSVTLLESCASGIVPITTKVDALPGVYGGVVPMVDMPIKKNIKEFAQLTIKALKDNEFRESVLSKTIPFAQEFAWPVLAKRLEDIIYKNRPELKK